MEKFISFEKLSKKKQRELNAKKRGSWHGLNPVTRRPENSKAYNRQKARKWSDDSMTVPFAISPHISSLCRLFGSMWFFIIYATRVGRTLSSS